MRIPFLLSSIKDFRQHVPNGQDSMVCVCLYLNIITYVIFKPSHEMAVSCFVSEKKGNDSLHNIDK